MDMHALSGGFADPARDAAHAFRACQQAMARPGRVFPAPGATPPAPLSPAAGAVLLTLVDDTTPLFLAPGLDTPALRGWIAFHLAAPICAPEEAVFALGAWADLPLDRFRLGTPDYPDRSVTLIVEIDSLSPVTARLRGPGIATHQDARLPAIEPFVANRARYPLGFDCYFCAEESLSALPRSTFVEAL